MTENSQNWPDLKTGEEDITNSSDTCFRNVHPEFISDGIVCSSAFNPSKDDEGEFSTARSSKVSPQRWVDNDSLQEESLRVTGHAYIDFRLCSSKGAKKKARSLARKAVQAYLPHAEE